MENVDWETKSKMDGDKRQLYSLIAASNSGFSKKLLKLRGAGMKIVIGI